MISRQTTSSRRARALTLVEALVAIVVVAIAAPPMLLAMRDASLRRATPVLADRARWLASEKLEDLIADRHSPARGYAFITPANYPTEPAVAGFPAFSRAVAITETAANLSSPGTGYKRVAVTVAWRDQGGTLRSLALSTILTDY
ncbi:MAG: prepilin-type N-terminal cleavage/methylation domain-containing protein [Phycisphaerae bacterium]|nr:prepilin-type N-terminal cleavage/methylation domain-containing protein [Phycisphaerae bacterium]